MSILGGKLCSLRANTPLPLRSEQPRALDKSSEDKAPAPLPTGRWFGLKPALYLMLVTGAEGLLGERAGVRAKPVWGGGKQGCTTGSTCITLQQKHPHQTHANTFNLRCFSPSATVFCIITMIYLFALM